MQRNADEKLMVCMEVYGALSQVIQKVLLEFIAKILKGAKF